MGTTEQPGTRIEPAGGADAEPTKRLEELLRFAAEREATDLHLKPMRPPLLRLGGKLVPTPGPALGPAELEALITRIVPPSQRTVLAERRRVEFGYSLSGVSRFRAVVYHQRGSLVATFRRLPWELPGFAELGLPAELQRIAGLARGVVLVAGPHGSGRSTTLAAIVREIADKRLVHVMTLEQPIEYPLRDGMGTVTQLEVGADTPGFAQGVKAALSEDADVIAIDGRLAPRERLRLLDAAAADRLVLMTLRAETASSAVWSFLEDIPEQWRRSAALRLADAFQAALALRLLDRADGSGQLPAVESLWQSAELREAITSEPGPGPLVPGGNGLVGALAALVEAGSITPDEALLHSPDPRALERRIGAEPAPVVAKPAPRASGFPSPVLEEEPTGPITELDRLRHLIDVEERYERLKSRYESLCGERDHRIEELERKLDQQQRRGSELSRQLQQLTEEKEQILHAVEREAERLEREERVQRRRLEELEDQLSSRRQSESQRTEQIEALERERRRTVEMVEAHCRDYEQRIGRLQAKLRELGIDPLNL